MSLVSPQPSNMKTFAVVLLCLVAAVQGRNAGAKASTPAVLGENPWMVHMRVAVSTSGFLNSCAASLIGHRWVLTSANCIRHYRFAWMRYGAVNVTTPELVSEAGGAHVHPDFDPETNNNDIAIVNTNWNVWFYDNIDPVTLPDRDAEIPSTLKFCGYGTDEAPGEILNCSEVTLKDIDEGLLVAPTAATRFDIGAPLVSDGVQYGVLSRSSEDGESVFVNLIPYLDWIDRVTDLSL